MTPENSDIPIEEVEFKPYPKPFLSVADIFDNWRPPSLYQDPKYKFPEGVKL